MADEAVVSLVSTLDSLLPSWEMLSDIERRLVLGEEEILWLSVIVDFFPFKIAWWKVVREWKWMGVGEKVCCRPFIARSWLRPHHLGWPDSDDATLLPHCKL